MCWYGETRKPGLHDPRPYACPDLVAEIRSPSTWRYDIGAKKSAYESHGLPELWLVDTADTLASPLLSGFSLTVAELFASD